VQCRVAWLKCASFWEEPIASTITSSENVGTFTPEDGTPHRHYSQKLRPPAVGLTNGQTVNGGKNAGQKYVLVRATKACMVWGEVVEI